MSSMIRHGKTDSSSRQAKLALILGVIWAVLLSILWFALRNHPGDGGGILNGIGRLHLIIVHLPIALLVLAGILEVLGSNEKRAALRDSIPLVLWLSVLGAVGATVFGFLLMKVEGTAGKFMPFHMWTGIGVTVFSVLALVALLKEKTGVYRLSLLLAVVAVSAAGHFGGEMTHGEGYITKHFIGAGDSENLAGEGNGEVPGAQTEDTPLEEKLAYTAFVAPILENKCNECHNEAKIKGKLRMDTHEMLMAGAEGSDYKTVAPGDPENSELLVRVTLPSDDDDFMPPNDKPVLTEDEIRILTWWIKGGADAGMTVGEMAPGADVLASLTAFEEIQKGAAEEEIPWEPEWDGLTDEEKETRLADAKAAAGQHNFSLMPISAEDDRLRVNVINAAKDFGDDQLKLLEPIAEQIVWLDVARSQVTDDGLKSVNKMRNLEKLHLENTRVTDAGIARLAPLSELEYLNLYGTEVSDAIFEHLAGMGNLKKLYVWQTKITPAAAKSFERSVNLEINTGVDLAAAPTPEADPPAEKAPAPKADPNANAKAKAPAPKADTKAPAAKSKGKAPAAKAPEKGKGKAKAAN
ncbi:MAG: hypothetical protein HKN23_01965 [Verrucomicrobiales bacterium]|nr:hypothetical protein [Verrucomicrobiales bacterium]